MIARVGIKANVQQGVALAILRHEDAAIIIDANISTGATAVAQYAKLRLRKVEVRSGFSTF